MSSYITCKFERDKSKRVAKYIIININIGLVYSYKNIQPTINIKIELSV